MRDINVGYATEGTYWDCFFTRDQLEELDIDEELMRHISVAVGAEDGKVTLNEGYAPGSPQNDAEVGLFAEYRHDIEAALLVAVSDEPEYDDFRNRMAADAPGMGR